VLYPIAKYLAGGAVFGGERLVEAADREQSQAEAEGHLNDQRQPELRH
jgi:hypothetical protein